MSDDILTGSCFCGGLAFTLRLPVIETYHCHCSVCRRLHGAAFVTWVKAHHDHFALTSGAERMRLLPLTVEQRGFCPDCGATVCSQVMDRSSAARNVWVPRAALHRPSGLEPTFHKYVASGAAWVPITDSLPRFAENGSLGGDTR